MIALNAQPIIDARLKGFAPAEMILVSLVGTIGEMNHTVHAKPELTYDWQWCRGLRIGVYVNRSVKFMDALMAIAKALPAYLCVWDTESERGARVFLRLSDPAMIDLPRHQWRYALDFSNWQQCDNEDFKKWN